MTLIAVKVVPRAARDEIVGWIEGELKIRVSAPPQDGRANRAVEALLAAALELNKTAVVVSAGAASRHKRVAIAGLPRDEVLRRLEAFSGRNSP